MKDDKCVSNDSNERTKNKNVTAIKSDNSAEKAVRDQDMDIKILDVYSIDKDALQDSMPSTSNEGFSRQLSREQLEIIVSSACKSLQQNSTIKNNIESMKEIKTCLFPETPVKKDSGKCKNRDAIKSSNEGEVSEKNRTQLKDDGIEEVEKDKMEETEMYETKGDAVEKNEGDKMGDGIRQDITKGDTIENKTSEEDKIDDDQSVNSEEEENEEELKLSSKRARQVRKLEKMMAVSTKKYYIISTLYDN